MTSDARTCSVAVLGYREPGDRFMSGHPCGETLVDDETSPCAHRMVEGKGGFGCGNEKAARLHQQPPRGHPYPSHAYVPSAYRCPVHGAVK